MKNKIKRFKIEFVNDYNKLDKEFYWFDFINISFLNMFRYNYISFKILGIGIKFIYIDKYGLRLSNERNRSKRKTK